LALLVSVALLVACGGGAGTGGGAATTAAPAATTTAAPAATTTAAPAANSGSAEPIVMWTFAETHAVYFRDYWIPRAEEKFDVSIRIEVMDHTALNDRLTIIINAGGEGSPDLVEIEQGQFNRYMRPGRMCLVPLNDYFAHDDVLNKMVEGRLSLYKFEGNYYGVEQALCPVTMAYRPDLFELIGKDVPATWDDYLEAARLFKEHDIYIAAQSDMRNNAFLGDIDILLRASDSQHVSANQEITITPVFKNLMSDFLTLQRDGMVYAFEDGADRWNMMAQDRVATMMMADWAAGWLRDNVPEQEDKWRMAPLPKVTPSASTTSCNGGTGLTMVEYTKQDKDLLWKLIYDALIETENVVKKFEIIMLYPPVYAAMPESNSPFDYYGGQVLGELYMELAETMPVQNQAWWRSLFTEAVTELSFDLYEGDLTVDEFFDKVVAGTETRMKAVE